MNKNLSIAAIVLFSIVGIYFVWSAIQTRRKSEELLSKFEEVNKGLDTVNNEKLQPHNYHLVRQNNEIILLIDSLITLLPSVPTQDLKRLLEKITMVTKSEWNSLDSAIPDTIRYWGKPGKFSPEIWLNEYFPKDSLEKSLRYLRFIKEEAIRNNY